MKNKNEGTHIGFAKWRVWSFYDSLVQGSSLVFQIKICAKKPPLRKSRNRWYTLINKNQ
jgi:hypothetical protein